VKILFDTNVILDVMLLRDPFLRAATSLLAEVERKNIEGFVCSTTVTIIYYLVSKAKGSKEAKKQVENLLRLFNVTHIEKRELESALYSDILDYEDAVLHESALGENLNGIVTRNTKDFRNSKLTVFNPEELLKIVKSSLNGQ
jgi:predicted nucleic acid-binding protein